MLEGEWRLQYPGVDYSWGGLDLVADPFRRLRGKARNREAPEFTDTELTLEDGDRPRQDGRTFGQDFRRGLTITFQMGARGAGTTNAAATADAKRILREQQLAWRGDGVRLQAGAMAKLTHLVDGVELTTYGRPRRWAPGTTNLHAGEGTAVATFDTMDDVWYGPEQQQRVDLVPPTSTQGVSLPVAPPHVLGVGQIAAGGIVVGGVLPAWVSAEVHGPIANPVVKLTGGWEWRLARTILTGQHVTLDARPWARTILTSAGGSYAGYLNRQYARLAEGQMQPGAHTLTLGGSDPTGTAYMILRWTPAHASMV